MTTREKDEGEEEVKEDEALKDQQLRIGVAVLVRCGGEVAWKPGEERWGGVGWDGVVGAGLVGLDYVRCT